MTSTSDDAHSGGGRDEVVSSAKARIASQPSRDPLVTALIWVIFTVVILTLVTVVYAMVGGVFGTGAPRTMGEKKIMAARAQIDAGSKDRYHWLAYIIALTDDGQYGEAQEWIDKGKKQLKDQDIYADMLYMQANLYLAQGKSDQALETADAAVKQIQDRYEQGKVEFQKSGNPDPAYSFGLVDTYWELLLLKAEVYESRRDWKLALSAYDEYLESEKTAATVQAQRGMVKEQLGDKEGAEADYRETLKFIPDNRDALAGLKRIGAGE